MAEVSEEFYQKLRNLRGEFENSRGGKIGNRFLAHVFSTVFPILFLGFLFFWSDFAWPFSAEQWLFLAFALITLATGLFFHRTINSRYLFDDEGVREFAANGKLRHFVPWDQLQKIEYRESRSIKTFTLIAEGEQLRLELYKSLTRALENSRS